MKLKEFDRVLLKDGRQGDVMDISPGAIAIDIGTSQNGNGARHKHITGHSQDIKEFQLDGSPYTVQTLFDRGYGVYGICMEYAS